MKINLRSKVMIICFELGKTVCFFLVISLCLVLKPVPGRAETATAADKEMYGHSDVKSAPAAEGKWLPIPTIITEPAIGYGFAMTLGYIHPRKEKDETETVPALQTPGTVLSSQSGRKPPPTISGVAAGYTEKQTWYSAVGHSTSWDNDRIRYAGLLTYADVNSTYFIFDLPLDFNLKGYAFYQGLKFRLGDSNFFLGGKFLYLQTKSSFETTIADTQIVLGNISSQDTGIALEASFDSRDNVFTPNSGQSVQATVWRFAETLGGDYSYWKSTFKALSYHLVIPNVVVGLRLEASAADGRPPFYGYPWVAMRGIPAMRYQGKRVGMLELEGRWNILPRWAVIGFFGKGLVSGDDAAFETRDNILAGGAGVRYLFMPEEGLWLGVDAARGPESWYTYVTVGSAW